jgi:hypothetical protein
MIILVRARVSLSLDRFNRMRFNPPLRQVVGVWKCAPYALFLLRDRGYAFGLELAEEHERIAAAISIRRGYNWWKLFAARKPAHHDPGIVIMLERREWAREK